MIRKLLLAVVLCTVGFATTTFGQDIGQLQAITLDSSLTTNANAVVRSYDLIVEVNSLRSVTVKKRSIVTVLNKKGVWATDTYENYDLGTNIKKLEATIYDSKGRKVKKYKKGDFEDQSATRGFNFVTDNRIVYLDYTPFSYPYTMIYESEINYTSSFYIRPWYPIKNYGVSIESSNFKFINLTKTGIRFEEKCFSEFNIKANNTSNELNYSIENVPAITEEVNSPLFEEWVPRVNIALDDFIFVGIKGNGNDWISFGKWEYENFVKDRDVLPKETIDEIKDLLIDTKSVVEKVKRIYQYVQSKTRYVSVQLGSGGLIPMQAKDVDKLGYGDCKALTNYTKALLSSQGILSYYSEVYGDEIKKDIDSNFVSVQGNHVILNVPDGEDDLWLECTNQDAPFNFIAGFTDDRDVLVLTPEGGVIKHTTKYPVSENTLETKATISVHEDQSISAKVLLKSKGTQYANRYRIPKKDKKDRELYYKNYWSYLNGLQLKMLNFQNDKDQVVFTETIDLSLPRYANKAGSRLLLSPNLFNREHASLPKYDDRKTALIIARGFVDTDVYEIQLPEGYQVGALPDAKNIETPFGFYECSVTKTKERTLTYKRKLQINEGTFSKEDYVTYRLFREQIKKADHAKIVLNKR